MVETPERQGPPQLARFEIVGLDADRDLVQGLARRLAENDAEAAFLREKIGRLVARPSESRGGVYAALRRSPLVGADLDVSRPFEPGRTVDP